MAFVLKGGRVVSASAVFAADVRVVDGRIESVGAEVVRAGDEILDVSGKFVLPGGIDVHTHFDLPTGDGDRTADSFATGTRAALAGGTTCIVDYATQFKGETLRQGLRNWHRLADGNCFCDYSFHLAITDWREELVRDLPEVVSSGVTSFKMYMAYKGALQVDDGVIYEALRRLKDLGGLLCVHCENGDLVAARASELVAAGCTDVRWHPHSRPEELETEAVNRLLIASALAEAPVYVVHVSASASMELIAGAKMAGMPVYAETCPQYLYLDDSLYGCGWESAKYVCAPPLREKRNQAGLWASLAADVADAVATDHCSFHFAGQKERGRADFTRIPAGMPGVESRMLLLYKGVADGRIDFPQMVRLASAGPAEIFGMGGVKGEIVPGADADILVLDTTRETTISAAVQHQNVDYTPFEGWVVPAAIDSVYLRGQRMFSEGRADGACFPQGRFLRRRPSGRRGVL